MSSDVLLATSRLRSVWHGLVTAMLVLSSASAAATDGEYDPAFASMGRRLVAATGGYDQARRMLMLADGRMLLAGSCRLPGSLDPKLCAARLRADGSYDPTFGPGGLGYMHIDDVTFPSSVYLTDAGLLSDGRIALLGFNAAQGTDLLAVLRADGTRLDDSVLLGYGWTYVTFETSFSNALTLRVQADDKVLVAGGATGVNGNTDLAVLRFRADLTGLDDGFGNAGIQTIAFDLGGPGANNSDNATAIAVGEDGRILLAGMGVAATNSYALVLAQLLSDGSPDPSFGADHDGRTVPLVSMTISATAKFDRRADIVYGTSDGYIGRLLADGSADPAFDGGLPIWIGYWQSIVSLAFQADGKILAAGDRSRFGTTGGPAPFWWAVTRLRGDGSFDEDYFGHGQEYGTFTDGSSGCCGYTDSLTDIVAGPTGIVIAGSGAATNDGTLRFGVARLKLDTIFGDSFD